MKTKDAESNVSRPSQEEGGADIGGMEKTVDLILKDHDYDRSSLISILLAIQERFNYLPKEALKMVAQKLKIRLIDTYSVATFYQVFSLTPRGKHIINVCDGTACHVRGSPRIIDKLKEKLNVETGCTTADMKFTLETVRCLGCCAMGPVIVVDGNYHGKLSLSKLENVLSNYN